MVAEALKLFLPDRPLPMRIWRGPFRGARIVMNPRRSLRKMLGLYEHELNAWLELALGRAKRVIDIGANDGYFTFGSAAALRSQAGLPPSLKGTIESCAAPTSPSSISLTMKRGK